MGEATGGGSIQNVSLAPGEYEEPTSPCDRRSGRGSTQKISLAPRLERGTSRGCPCDRSGGTVGQTPRRKVFLFID